MKANPKTTPVPDKIQILNATLKSYQAWVRAGKPVET